MPGCWVSGVRFWVSNCEFRFQGSGFRFQGAGFTVQGPGSRVLRLEFGVEELDHCVEEASAIHVGSTPGHKARVSRCRSNTLTPRRKESHLKVHFTVEQCASFLSQANFYRLSLSSALSRFPGREGSEPISGVAKFSYRNWLKTRPEHVLEWLVCSNLLDIGSPVLLATSEMASTPLGSRA